MQNIIRNILLLLVLLIHNNLFAQTKSYSVALAPFSSLKNDEFSPVYYKNGIVFCSNLRNNSLINYQNNQNNLFNIFFVAGSDSINWQNAKILAKELTTNYNEGPATFNEKGNLIYYCRNYEINEQIKNISDTTNKLGLYSAVFIGEKWTNSKPFIYNDPLYTFTTPALTYDGKRLYFSSDMPGGYGEFDLYYCDSVENGWSKPVNLGPVINTSKSESFPFACKSGKLFFTSNGHSGFGGKDIFYSQEINGKWISSIHLDSEINSPGDDFGLVTDPAFEKGFFSSNRRKTDDIFSFTATPMQFDKCDSMLKNFYCFIFYDENNNNKDTIAVEYEWDFGNGIKKRGIEVKHCFAGPGKYEVWLNIIDSLTGDSVIARFIHRLELKEINQAYINSSDADIVDNNLSFDGLKTNLPGIKISDYLWDFGEGFKIRGPSVNKVFTKSGEYTVQLGLLGEKDSLNNMSKTCVYKKIKIFNDYQELAMHASKEIGELDEFYTIDRPKKSGTTSNESTIVIWDSSEVKPFNTLMVRIYLPNDMPILQKDKIFSNIYELKDGEIELINSGIAPVSYPIFKRFLKVLQENPNIRLEIAVHTDDKGFTGNNLEITEKWAQDIYTYFSDNGITGETLHCKGYGESRPMVDENKKEGKNINRRVEFIFVINPN